MTETTTQEQKKVVQPVWLVATGVLTVLGIIVWVVQLQQGIGVTSQSNFSPWGLYIAGFIFFMGLSAGSLVLAALPVLFALPKFRPYAKLSAFVALISLIVGGLFILVDIGKPERLWRIVRYAELGSPMLWDLLLTVVYLVVSTVYLRRLMQAKGNSNEGLKLLALLAFLAGLADGITAFVFATQVGREYWFSAVQPMAFFTAALASAGAVMLVLMVVLKRSEYVSLECCDLNPIAGLTAVAVGLNLLLVASELITMAFTRSASALELVNVMLSTPLFWVEVMAGVATMVFLLLPAARSNPGWLAGGGGLALVHLVAKRIVFVQMGFAIPNITYPGVVIDAGASAPTVVEWAVVLGLAGLFGLLLSIGLRSLKLGAQQTT